MARFPLVLCGWLLLALGANCQDSSSSSLLPSSTQDGTAIQVTKTIIVVPVQSTPESTSTAPVTTSAPYTCDRKGPVTQTGNITTTFLGAKGEVRFTGACSEYVSKYQDTTATTDVWGTSYPNFILQTVNDQACDIYGPLCQTGSITVGVDLDTATTTTTVDCSLYLSAESYSNRYLKTNLAFAGKGAAPPYLRYFGRQSECRSWASQWTASPATVSYSNCNNASSTLATWQDYQPMGLNLMNSPAEYYAWFSCCGTCQFYADGMRLIYFPPANLTCFHAGNGTDIGGNSTTSLKIDPANGSTAVYKGVTMTSPSVYVEIIGTAGITDSCGQVEPVITNPIVGVDLTELSTMYVSPVSDGQTYFSQWRQYQNAPYKGWRQLTLSDLACPTFGLSDPEFDSIITNELSSFVNEYTKSIITQTKSHYAYHFGAPYNPVVSPPKKLISYHSSWLASCGTIGDGNERLLPSWGVIDPPVFLTAQRPIQPSSQPPPADPQTTLPPPSHTTMFNPSTVRPGSTMVAIPVKTNDPPSSGGGGNNNGGDPDPDPPGNGGGNNDPGTGGGDNGGGNNDPGGNGNSDGDNDPGSGGSNNGGSSPGNQGPGIPTTIALPTPQPGSQTVITIGYQPVTVAAASTAIIGGSTIHAGDPAITVGGSVYSIDNSGSMIVAPTAGGAVPFTTIPLSVGVDSMTVTQGGHTIVVASGNVVDVDGISASAGESAITVSGTVYSVDSTGGLVVATGSPIVPGSGSSLRSQFRTEMVWYATAFAVFATWIV